MDVPAIVSNRRQSCARDPLLELPAAANPGPVDNAAAVGAAGNPNVPPAEAGRDVDDTSAPISETNLAIAAAAQFAAYLTIGQAMMGRTVATAPTHAALAGA